MSVATVRRRRTPSLLWFVLALLLAIPLGIFAQAPAQGRGGGGQRGGAPAGAPAAPAAPPAAGAPAAAPAGQGRGGQGGGAPAAPANARTAAPVDLTGYWVSVVTEDWIERMSPDSPPSGTGGRGGRGAAAAPAAAIPPEPCRVYAAGGSMRVPGRLNITWADDNTLKIEMDAGTQTRLLRFGAPAPTSGEKTLQGYSVATWEGGGGGGGRGGGGGGRGGAAAPATRWGKLNVVTTNMKGGYLLSSRSSYSENAVLTEYFVRHAEFGVEYLTIVAALQDGGGNPRTVSSTFKKEPNGSKFSPTGCEIVR